jgi:hypothetical protein
MLLLANTILGFALYNQQRDVPLGGLCFNWKDGEDAEK